MARKLLYADQEGGMAKSQLMKIENYAAKLNDMIHPDDELEAWVQGKLSVIAAYMGDIKHYLDYELKKFADAPPYADGGAVSFMPKEFTIEFTWDKSDEDFDSRKVNVIADDMDEAKRMVTDKFAPYYDGFRIIKEYAKDGKYEDYEMVVISKDAEKDGGGTHTHRYLVSAKNIKEAKEITTEMFLEEARNADYYLFKVMSDSLYRLKYMN